MMFLFVKFEKVENKVALLEMNVAMKHRFERFFDGSTS